MNPHSTFDFQPLPAAVTQAASKYVVQAATLFHSRLYLAILRLPGDAHHSGKVFILRHRLEANHWDLVYEYSVESRWVLHEGQPHWFPLELGCHALTVLPGSRQPVPVLYAVRLTLQNPGILRSGDGEHFEEFPNPGATIGHSPPFIGLRSFSGKTFAIPAALQRRTVTGALLYVTDDPFVKPWTPAGEPGLGHTENATVDGLLVFADHLYAALGNSSNGFQLWKTIARDQPPFAWNPVLTEGAQRYTLNSHITSIAVFKGALYLGAGASPMIDASGDAPVGAEIIRVLPDDRWELVMGTPRFSPVGLQIPLSTHGPGFGDPHHQRIARLVGTPDTLYAAIDQGEDPPSADSAPTAPHFQLWKTRDGEDWQMIPPNTFGQPGVTRLRVLQPTPHGLVVAGDWDLTRDPEAQPGIWLEKR